MSSPPTLGQHDDAGWSGTPARPVTSAARPARPLEGVRVADFSWFGAGPIAGQTLASFGAEVVRVESEARIDSLRIVEPVALNEDGSKMSDTYNASGYFTTSTPASSASSST